MLTLEVKRTNDIFSVIVTEQSNKINNLIDDGFYSETTKWDINCISTPEINFQSRKLYLRGISTLGDFRESNVTLEILQLVYNTLYDFAENYDLGITYDVYENYAEIKIDESNTRIKASIGLEDIQSNDMIRCRHCKEFFNPDDIHLEEIDEQNKHLCNKCFNKIATKCISCNAFITKVHEFTRSNSERFKVCASCKKFKVTQCDGCGGYEIIHISRLEIEIGEDGNLKYGKRLCGICLSKIDKKDCRLHVYANKYDNCLCTTSYNFKSDIYSHNTNVLDSYGPDKDTKELFGIEIEVGTHRRNRGFFKEILEETKRVIASDAITKWDASIDYLDGSNKEEPNDYCGFEITTRPMNYKNAGNFLKKLAKERHSLLRCWEVGTTGIHIHVNKKYLRPIEIGKILLFMNAATNRDFIIALAKRNEKKYAKFLKRSIFNFGDSSPSCHYHAVNTSKPNTIEFRVFRGTLNKNTMVSYLQFVKSLIEFIKVAPIGGTPPYVSTRKNQLTYKQYVDWLFTTNRSQYRELKSRICNEDMKTIIDGGEI